MSAAAVDTAGKQAGIPSDFPGQPIWSIPRRGGFVIANEREYKGRSFIDLRHWADGGAVATKQVVTFQPEAVGELAQALWDHYAHARAGT